MSALIAELPLAPKSLLSRLWGLRGNDRWVKNTKISAAIWVLNFGVLAIGMKTVADQVTYRNDVVSQNFQLNLYLSIAWDFLWFFVNRRFIWPDRAVATSKCARSSASAWLLFFVINQSLYLLLTGRADIDWYYVKPMLIAVSIGRYVYNDRRVFKGTSQEATG